MKLTQENLLKELHKFKFENKTHSVEDIFKKHILKKLLKKIYNIEKNNLKDLIDCVNEINEREDLTVEFFSNVIVVKKITDERKIYISESNIAKIMYKDYFNTIKISIDQNISLNTYTRLIEKMTKNQLTEKNGVLHLNKINNLNLNSFRDIMNISENIRNDSISNKKNFLRNIWYKKRPFKIQGLINETLQTSNISKVFLLDPKEYEDLLLKLFKVSEYNDSEFRCSNLFTIKKYNPSKDLDINHLSLENKNHFYLQQFLQHVIINDFNNKKVSIFSNMDSLYNNYIQNLLKLKKEKEFILNEIVLIKHWELNNGHSNDFNLSKKMIDNLINMNLSLDDIENIKVEWLKKICFKTYLDKNKFEETYLNNVIKGININIPDYISVKVKPSEFKEILIDDITVRGLLKILSNKEDIEFSYAKNEYNNETIKEVIFNLRLENIKNLNEAEMKFLLLKTIVFIQKNQDFTSFNSMFREMKINKELNNLKSNDKNIIINQRAKI